MKEFETFRDNVDTWIKQIRREFAEFSGVPSIIDEHGSNIQHNYELIYELKDKIDDLQQEVKALKLVQITNLKITDSRLNLQEELIQIKKQLDVIKISALLLQKLYQK
ncbi:MAG: hypothetical protein AABY22_22950 [Nanoarchaeota archaeon]